MDTAPSGLRGREAFREWVNCISVLSLVMILSTALSYIFIWTHQAGSFQLRSPTMLFVAISSAAASVLALLLYKFRVLQLSSGASSLHGSSGVFAATFLVLLIMALAAESLTEQAMTWGSLPRIALWEVPLCLLLMITLLKLPVRSVRGNLEAACLAVVGGVGTGYALTANLGSIWATAAIFGVACGCGILKRWKAAAMRDVSVISLLVPGTIFVVLVQVMFGAMPASWNMAILFVNLISCAVVVRVAVIKTQDHANTVRRDWWRQGRWLDGTPWELLPVGWVAVLFVTLAWNEPALEPEPQQPVVYRVPEFDGRSSQSNPSIYNKMASHGLREWKRTSESEDYAIEAAVAREWNAFVEREVFWRRAIKVTGWLVVGVFTLVGYLKLEATRKKTLAAGADSATTDSGGSQPAHPMRGDEIGQASGGGDVQPVTMTTATVTTSGV